MTANTTPTTSPLSQVRKILKTLAMVSSTAFAIFIAAISTLCGILSIIVFFTPETPEKLEARKAKEAARIEAQAREKARRDAQEEEETMLFTASYGCKERVRHSSKFPSKAKFTSERANRAPGGIILVVGGVELMNGFGAMIPHTFFCAYDPKTKTYDKPIITVGG